MTRSWHFWVGNICSGLVSLALFYWPSRLWPCWVAVSSKCTFCLVPCQNGLTRLAVCNGVTTGLTASSGGIVKIALSWGGLIALALSGGATIDWALPHACPTILRVVEDDTWRWLINEIVQNVLWTNHPDEMWSPSGFWSISPRIVHPPFLAVHFDELTAPFWILFNHYTNSAHCLVEGQFRWNVSTPPDLFN